MTKSAHVPLTPITAAGSGLALLLLTPTVERFLLLSLLANSGYPAPAPGQGRCPAAGQAALPQGCLRWRVWRSSLSLALEGVEQQLQLLIGG